MSFLLTYKPAYVAVGKETMVVYYALEPISGQLTRKRIKLNHIRDQADRMKYARKLCSEINRKLMSGWSPFMPYGAPEVITFKKALTRFQEEKVKELRQDSIRCYNSYLRYFSEFIRKKRMMEADPEDFTPAFAKEYMLSVGEQVSARTFNGYLRFQKTFFNWLISHDYVTRNPFDKVKTKRVDEKTRTTIPADIRHKIDAYFISVGKFEFTMFMRATYRCFIRPKELCQIRIEDYDKASGILTIPAQVAKNHKERKVAITSEIASYLNAQEAPNFYYIFSEGWKPGKRMMTTRDSGREWARMRKALQLPMCYQFYSLKDSGITEMLEAGVPPKFVKELADHASIATTEKYTKVSRAEERLQYSERLQF